MKQTHRALPRLLRLLTLAALMGAGVAHADDYAEITQLIKSGNSADALIKVEQRLLTSPRDPQLRFLLGVAQTDSGKPADAVTTFTKLTQEYPELPEPYNNLAVLYANQNQLDKARTALEMAIRTNPSYATAQENLGDIYAKLASQAYNKALQLDGNNATSVKPKLALIRELFSAGTPGNPATGNRTTAPTAAVAPAPKTASAPVSAPSAAAVAPAAVPAAAAPAAAAAKAPAAAPTTDSTSIQAVTTAVQAWADAWAAKDMKAYLASYDKSFNPPGQQTREAWEKEREARIVGKSKISVRLSNLTVTVNGSKATARFRQAYSADALNVASRKTLDLIRNNGRWTIVRESTGG